MLNWPVRGSLALRTCPRFLRTERALVEKLVLPARLVHTAGSLKTREPAMSGASTPEVPASDRSPPWVMVIGRSPANRVMPFRLKPCVNCFGNRCTNQSTAYNQTKRPSILGPKSCSAAGQA